MKVVLFCGGYGMRMRDGVTDLPKPMTRVGPRPLIWHVMRYYAHFGHKDFVLCLGYGADHIKDYFLNYRETASNDFTLRRGELEMHGTDVEDWTITFVHTGMDSAIGERLRRVREYVQDEEVFLANYSDVLTDLPLDLMIDKFRSSGASAALLAVPPQSAFHCVDVAPDGMVTSVTSVSKMDLWENGGYLILTPEVFDHLPVNGDLVEDACVALAKQNKLLAYQYSGFWRASDTMKERNALEAGYQAGNRPWMLWETTPDRDPFHALAEHGVHA
ncbi:glucose-1-phosphate cytidylyltransferase [Pseudonocardia ailaonensis]|uniref:Glucose-1-phosphate cytidylyltransferase n=1 Tax=Pseudonocardia ailaonensis TaxID=367279 RepID=A0ABN2NB03_9PSEU